MRPGIGYRGGVKVVCGIVLWSGGIVMLRIQWAAPTGYCVIQLFIVHGRKVKLARVLKESAQIQAIKYTHF